MLLTLTLIILLVLKGANIFLLISLPILTLFFTLILTNLSYQNHCYYLGKYHAPERDEKIAILFTFIVGLPIYYLLLILTLVPLCILKLFITNLVKVFVSLFKKAYNGVTVVIKL